MERIWIRRYLRKLREVEEVINAPQDPRDTPLQAELRERLYAEAA